MKQILSIIFLIFACVSLNAQLENVIIEKYYISDANDAKDVQYITDNLGNNTDTVILKEGSTTYRIYIQLSSGYVLTKIYGDANHTLKISSTDFFFNNISRGVSFGKDLISSRLQYNTVALDSWLTLGLAARTLSGVLKAEDTDGSIVGGTHNKSGMLVNNDANAGIPLTTSDGLAPLVSSPSIWLQNGIVNSAGDDTTIFGSLKIGKQFVSNNAFLQNSGVSGVNANSNKILIAQLTTKGDISFELNIQLQKSDGSSTTNFVAKRSPLDAAQGNVYSALLSYPQVPLCGCKDPDFIEYNPNFDCNSPDSCKIHIIMGCMDPQACNYDPNANYSIKSLCCYPGLCSDRDISKVCPDLGSILKSGFILYPNPVNSELNLEVTADNKNNVKIEIYNSFGKLISIKNLGTVNGKVTSVFDMSNLENGIYLARFFAGETMESKLFVKN